MKKRIIIAGGGASGLMAAAAAAAAGAEVLLLEKKKTPARKLRISGKGRCNLTNTAPLEDFLAHFGRSGRFLRQAFGRFFVPELVEFFESRGLALREERGGRIFPMDGDAPAVVKLLVSAVQSLGVEVKTGMPVKELIIENGSAKGVVAGTRRYRADQVILCVGGASYPLTGSTGDGYRIAEKAGHTIIPIRPALVPLKIDERLIRSLAGLELKNIQCRLYVDGKRKRQEFGECSFISSGISGPVILTMSLMAVDALRAGKTVGLSLDLKPALDDAKLEARLIRDLESRAKEPMASVLRGLLPRTLVGISLEETAIDDSELAGRLSAKARKRLRTWLKDFRMEIVGHADFDEAIVTAGGVKTGEIDPYTMESRIVDSLYIVGELLDLQADTGGYNLQAAFSTGWLAGTMAAR